MKKKVLFLITSLSLGGAEKHVLSLAKELLHSREFYPIIAVLSERGTFYKQVTEANIPIFTIKRKFRYDLFVILKIAKLLKRENVSILHTHMFYSNIIGRFAGKLAKTKVIISTEHGQSLWKNKLLVEMDRLTQGFVDKVITVSEVSKEIRRKRERIKKDKLIKIHNFVSLDEFSVNNKNDKNLKEKYHLQDAQLIGMLTRLNQNKRVQDAIIAMRTVVQKFPLAKLIILGDGPLRQELKDLSVKLGIERHILFAGYQENTRDWLSIFNLFLIISLREDFPISLLEAMAMAKPVIATNVGGISEVLSETSGFLIAPESPLVLAEKIIWILKHPNKSKEMGQNGFKRIHKHFTNEIIIPQILSLYKKCLMDKTDE